jgi:hypothetical protein
MKPRPLLRRALPSPGNAYFKAQRAGNQNYLFSNSKIQKRNKMDYAV